MEELETTVEKQRYSRLQHLLQKSNVYSEFLLQRIEEQKTENEKRKAREAKRAEKAKKEDDKELPQTVPDTKRGRKCNQKSTGYNITDYVDTEALKKSSQESIAVSCVPDKDDNKNLSIGHHSNENETPRSETTGYKRPQLLTGGSLRDYQIEGVEWLKVLFENGVNGILADEMGLGKTIQCIALIAHLIENGVLGPFLVTAPLSTLPNWLAEFKRFTPGVSDVVL
ncbi:lymphoid-specific helicase [Paramuricea clavata]|uniref:Lymphoid-specific helicase n=1 Tax=Paramuricea clavata TaxID=317549 RepID=A0A6S7H5X0_PARCT|nr:lymphoid-specific helicase [Paramuricea clavata]